MDTPFFTPIFTVGRDESDEFRKAMGDGRWKRLSLNTWQTCLAGVSLPTICTTAENIKKCCDPSPPPSQVKGKMAVVFLLPPFASDRFHLSDVHMSDTWGSLHISSISVSQSEKCLAMRRVHFSWPVTFQSPMASHFHRPTVGGGGEHCPFLRLKVVFADRPWRKMAGMNSWAFFFTTDYPTLTMIQGRGKEIGRLENRRFIDFCSVSV